MQMLNIIYKLMHINAWMSLLFYWKACQFLPFRERSHILPLKDFERLKPSTSNLLFFSTCKEISVPWAVKELLGWLRGMGNGIINYWNPRIVISVARCWFWFEVTYLTCQITTGQLVNIETTRFFFCKKQLLGYSSLGIHMVVVLHHISLKLGKSRMVKFFLFDLWRDTWECCCGKKDPGWIVEISLSANPQQKCGGTMPTHSRTQFYFSLP